MLKNSKLRRPLSLILALSTLLIASGCSTTNTVQQESGITIERIDSSAATISNAYLTYQDGFLSLRGEVKRRLMGRGPIIGHLHVALIDPEGNTLKVADINYMRRNIKSSTASFSERLPLDLSEGSTVRITHFNSEHHDNLSSEPVWRD